MERRRFIRLVGGGVVTAAAGGALSGCSAGMPPEAIAPWSGPGQESDLRRWVLAYAILAPHSHNLQSWVADLRPAGEILLFCDPQRLLPETDPFARQIMMSHGTFLELLDLAARERGHRAEIELFPAGPYDPREAPDRPIARIRLVADSAAARDPLFGQILRRRTNRSLYDLGRPVPEAAWQAMAAAVAPHPVRFGHVGPQAAEALQRHRDLASEAWRIELTTPRAMLETFRVLRVGAGEVARHRDGVTLLDPFPVALARLGLFDRTRAPGPDDYATTSQIKDFDAKLASTPGFLWMVTDANDRATQVNAGRAYARVQLAATAQGVSMQPLQQALQEYPEQAGPYARIHALVGAPTPGSTVQMWARAGFAPEVSPAPRRGVEAIMRT
ncbi:MAG: twin-arginine translocation pathway signal protein [Ideonella sp.]|nr:twin-arginine translocation pathway signal protein [Ideonella sp.]